MIDFTKEPIRALNWKQPFASLMLFGKIETRTWETKYRGLVLICASKIPYSEGQIQNISGEVLTQSALVALLKAGHIEPLAKAMAVGRLVDCRPMRKEDEAKCFVQYYPDLWCHVYEDVKAIKPFDWKGAQKWKKVDQEIINKIEFI